MLLELNVKAKQEQKKEVNFVWWDDEPTKPTDVKKLMKWYDHYKKWEVEVTLTNAKIAAAKKYLEND